jgi:hypothetical protein
MVSVARSMVLGIGRRSCPRDFDSRIRYRSMVFSHIPTRVVREAASVHKYLCPQAPQTIISNRVVVLRFYHQAVAEPHQMSKRSYLGEYLGRPAKGNFLTWPDLEQSSYLNEGNCSKSRWMMLNRSCLPYSTWREINKVGKCNVEGSERTFGEARHSNSHQNHESDGEVLNFEGVFYTLIYTPPIVVSNIHTTLYLYIMRKSKDCL